MSVINLRLRKWEELNCKKKKKHYAASSRRFVKATTMVVTDYGCDADGKVKALCNRPTQLQCTFVVTWRDSRSFLPTLTGAPTTPLPSTTMHQDCSFSYIWTNVTLRRFTFLENFKRHSRPDHFQFFILLIRFDDFYCNLTFSNENFLISIYIYVCYNFKIDCNLY